MSAADFIAFDYRSDPTDEEDFLFGELHSCNTPYVGPCRACAQASVVHDDGDEQPGAFEGRRGVWLVGGGRNHVGIIGPTGCGICGIRPPTRGDLCSLCVMELRSVAVPPGFVVP